MTPRRLSRSAGDARPTPPVRLVHLGAGNFFRAHQAWYTEHAGDAADWGIAAFTGRSPAVAEALAGQDGLYTLVVQAADGDRDEVIGSLAAAHAADDLTAWRRYFGSPELAVVTCTVTEAGYRRAADGGLDRDDPDVRADIAALRSDPEGEVSTAPGKLVAGLLARRAAGVGPLTLVPCDNVPDNGAMLRRVATELAAEVDAELPSWIEEHVGFVTTMVDRITPRATPADRAALADRSGIDDPALVVTEPFAEWVLAGDFVAGRPRWEDAGARFVDDIGPFETQKLRLLNGSHSLMAYAATILGHESVSDAIADPVVRAWVEQWWDAAAATLELPAAEIDAYRAALLERYGNPRIRHLLAQIASDGSQKIAIRIVPVVRAALATGAPFDGASRPLAAWILHLRGLGAPVVDPQAQRWQQLAAGALETAVPTVLAELDLPENTLAPIVLEQARELAHLTR